MILEAILRGDFSIDNFPYPSNPDYKQAAAKVSAMITNLKENLSPENFSLLDQLLNQITTTQYMEATACFRTGFAAGVELQRELELELAFCEENR